ncbi:MAG: hypothetical protein ABR609_09725 [Acidimicrobiia bacterium]
MRRALVVMFLLAGLFAISNPAIACSCASAPPKQMLEFGPIAFVGTVSEVGAAAGSKLLTFQVDTVLAGELPAVADVWTASDGAACGIEAGVGARIAVFATEEAGRLTSNLCSTTDPDTAIQELGPGTAPLQPADLEAPFDWPAVWLGVGALALVGGAWLAIRRLS